MTEPINLNRARKARAREEARRRADANAARHGRSLAEREADRARAEREASRLERHRRERGPSVWASPAAPRPDDDG